MYSLDPKPSRQKRQKRRDKRLTDGILGKSHTKVTPTGRKRRAYAAAQRGDFPQRERIKAHINEYDDYFRGDYGLIRSILERRVGQHWDSVYSELRQRLSGQYRDGRPLSRCLWWFVHRRVILVAGKPYNGVRCDGRPTDHSLRPGDLYIHPRTHFLCRHAAPKAGKKKPSKAAIRRHKRHQKCLRKKGRLPTPAHLDTVAHSVVRTRQQILTVGTTYDLRIKASGRCFTLRARLVSVNDWIIPPRGRTLRFCYRKGVLPPHLNAYAAHDDAIFHLTLRTNGEFFFDPPFREARYRYGQAQPSLQVEILDAGSLEIN